MKEDYKIENTYKFLTNDPLGEDLFENQSQKKIAQVIKEKIINNPEFKIIGIDGEWGSGKSNLVKLLENKLKETHRFFIYDVWGHQEDEQRKAILVELTDFIKEEKDLLKKKDKKSWDGKLKVLLAKSKETTTINQPYLSVGFIFSLLSIVYIPTVNVFKDTVSDYFEIKSLFWKLILVTFPIFIVLCIYLWNLIKYWYNKRGFCKSFRLSAEETFQVYTNRQKEETKIETISEDQPSVRDFQNWMEEINNDLNKPIIIVFDNFDRLPKKHILNIWSSIHIFFAEKKYSNIKVIIPFDREHVQNAFKEQNSTDTKFGNDYVNKTFDIVFRITLPIMSNWKKFFEDQWKNAFLNYDTEELRLVIQVYEFLHHRITPREIISFINEILTVKLLDENFKERYIAIFILRKDEILKDPLKAVTEFNELLGGLYHIYATDLEYPKQLTAIIYHIEVEKALELIYTQELKESMQRNDEKLFNKICKSDFIDSIFISATLEIETFENPILALASLNEDSKVSTQHILQTWSSFYNKVLALDTPVTELRINDWQIALIKNNFDNRYLKNLLDKFFDLIDDSNIEQYIDLIDDLIIDLGEEKIVNLLTKRNISEKNYIKLIEYSGEKFKKYKLSTNYKLLDEYLANLTVDEILNIKNTKFLPKDYEFKKLHEALQANLSTLIDHNKIEPANELFLKLKERAQKNGDLKYLLEDDKIYRLFINNSSSQLPIINELIAMRIARDSSFPSSYKNQFNNVLNKEDIERADAIANTILNYISYGELLLMSDHFKNSPLFKQVISLMFNKSDLGKLENIMILIDKYSEIKDNLKIEDSSLLKELNKWEIDKDKFNVNELSDEFIDDCIENSELRISKDFLEVFNTNFKYLDKESYEIVFDDETEIHFKYFRLIELENLTQESLNIFEKKLIEKLTSTNEINKQWWEILKIYDFNNTNISIVNTFKNLLDKIMTSKIDLKVEYANILLPYFIKYKLLDKQSDIFRLLIKNEFLSNSGFLQLLTSNSEYIKDIYRNAIRTDKEGFRNLLNEKRDEHDEFENLAKLLDIRKTKIKSEEE